jgi:ketosteroid isomerase-like protein
MADRWARLREAFAALDDGDLDPFRRLLAPEAQWHGVPGLGWDGATAT